MLLKRLVENLREEKNKIENYVISGQIHDFSSYRFLCELFSCTCQQTRIADQIDFVYT